MQLRTDAMKTTPVGKKHRQPLEGSQRWICPG
ncbi:hypothetical protein LTSEWAN_0561, partial [Salmonella enterica subsp. enterica serovar Wandsworth str. A4-580]